MVAIPKLGVLFTYIVSVQSFLAQVGGLAHMVERSLSMREVPGSIPGFSRHSFFSSFMVLIC